MKYYSYLIIFWVSVLTSVHAKYPSQLQLAFKYGNHRSVGRGHMLIPLWQQPHQLLFAHIIGLFDKDHNHEGNVGLGYRQQKQDYILSAYGYYDHRYSTYHHHFHQVTLGLEYLTSRFEARFNGYWPFHGKHLLKRQGISLPKFIGAHYRRASHHQQTFEYALGGFDTELGFKLPKLPLHLYGGYYYFKRQGLASLQGPRIRTHLPIAAMLSLSAECHYDRPRGLNYLLGFELNLTLGAKRSSSGLAQKMIQPPIRDIDIIIQAGEQTIEINTQTATSIESYADLDKIRENLSGHYMVTKDIVAVGQKHSPIGNEDTPFTGIIVGISNDKSQLQQREIRGLVLDGSQKNMGLFGYIDHACIGYLSICYHPVHLTHFIRGESIGGLVGEAYAHNILIHNRNLSHLLATKAFVGGLVGYAVTYNKFIHNVNYGTLTAKGPNSHIGGIVGSSHANNVWIHNLNLGTITLYPMKFPAISITCYAGGIVSLTGRNNILTYNTNAGNIQAIGHKGSHIGGIAGSIGSSTICTHNVNVALLSGDKLGGIVSRSYKQNTFSYNLNAGSLTACHPRGAIGGIVESAIDNNIISYNINSGKIAGKDPMIGGIVMRVYKGNVLSYNVNLGELSSCKRGRVNTIGGIVVELRKHNMISHNINIGTILVDPKSKGEPALEPELKKYNMIGGIVSYLFDAFYNKATHNKITHNIQAGVITVGEGYVENYVGGIIGQHRDFSGNYFEHNIYSSALISHAPTTEHHLQSDPEAHLDGDNPFIDVTDFSTLPNGYFGLTKDWLLTTKGPMLTWLLKDRVLHLLHYFNYLKIIHADDYLPLEMMLAIASILDDFSYLSIAHIQCIYHYAFTAAHDLVHHLSQPKCHWSKEDFLVYVLENI